MSNALVQQLDNHVDTLFVIDEYLDRLYAMPAKQVRREMNRMNAKAVEHSGERLFTDDWINEVVLDIHCQQLVRR